MRWCALATLLLAGCFADETLLSGGAVCRDGPGWWCGFDGVPGVTSHLYYSDANHVDEGTSPAGARYIF